jgi:thiamine pyrophosphokinase
MRHRDMCAGARCVVVGGAPINCYERARGFIKNDDFVIYCDSGLKHLEGLGAAPALIIGAWDSYDDPHMDVETITLPVAKDDTDTVYAVREGMKRGFSDFILLGAVGARLDHTLVNVYILTTLANRGCHGMIVDDYSEMELISSCKDEDGTIRPGRATVEDKYPFFSLIAPEGEACGVSIRNAKFGLDGASIGPDYQYATSNEVLPGKSAEITVKDGRLLLIKIIE